ncbi:UNVERIFIED_CONTAM: protein JINGUBANG [Sesamum angustifolium]|uniref:Protein JINGUBANG n=1 Tax=Sesamum angustifolium TaxID=2727405 RepID=A0AAW2LGV4_9LAMI
MRPSDQTYNNSMNASSSVHSLSSQPPPPHLLHGHHQCIATLKGRNAYTSSLVLAGEFLVTGSSDKEIRLRSLSSLALDDETPSDDHDLVVAAGNGAVKALVSSSDNKLIISAHQDHKIRVWKMDHVSKFHQQITHLATLPTLSDRALKLLAPKSRIQVRRHKKCTWIHHVDSVSALALSTDEMLLYSVSWDRTLKVWRTTDFKCLESIANAHDDAINAIALSDDGLVYTASSDTRIRVWSRQESDSKTHSLVNTLEKHDSGVNALALTGDGMVLYSGGSDGSILVWRIEGGGRMAAVGALRGHSKSILCLDVVVELLFSGSADKTVRIWRGVGRSYYCLAVLEGHKGPVKCIAAAYDHNSSANTSNALTCLLYSGSLDCDIKVWKIFLPF